MGSILPLPATPDGNLESLPESQETQLNKNEQKLSEDLSEYNTTRIIGMVRPPKDIRSIVEKTAQFVAKNGPEFEKRIIANNTGNTKFSFLILADPYHAYYQHRLSKFCAQNQSSGQQPSDSAAPESASPTPDEDCEAGTLKPNPSAQFRLVCKLLVPPEAEQYTVRLPEGITGEDLDIIKLTSQFVARTGRTFLQGFTSREISNPQFSFLKPTHSMFTFFTSLVDAYSKVLMPTEGVQGLQEKLKRSVADMTTVLERCVNRLEWERSQDQARQKAEEEIEQERIQMAMIDWHDFVVVETIYFADDEDVDLPPPMNLEEVIRKSKLTDMGEDIIEPCKEVEMEMDEEEMQLVEEGLSTGRLKENADENRNENKVMEHPEPSMRIVKNWKRPEDRIQVERDPTKYVISPITRELIPINEMSEHMRISLIDPKYKEQKERMFATIRETTLAQDEEISRNIVGLAGTRPDIFGTTEEEVSHAVKAEIDKKKDDQPKQVIWEWDGHSGSIGRTANQAMSQNINVEGKNDIKKDASNLAGPAALPPKPGLPSVRPLPPTPGLALNLPRLPNTVQCSAPTGGGFPVPAPSPPVIQYQSVPPPGPPMTVSSGQQSLLLNRPPPLPPSMFINVPNIPVPPPPGSQFTHMHVPGAYIRGPIPPHPLQMMPPPPLPQAMPPPPAVEAPPPLPEEPDPKRQKLDDSMLIPEDQFLAQNPRPVGITICVPNLDEGNLKGQRLEITVQSLCETVGSLKERISGEIQLPANKQKLSGKSGFLKDNVSLAYYNVGVGETLFLSLRERGGRKR